MLLAFVGTVLAVNLAGLFVMALTPAESVWREYGALGIFCGCLITGIVALSKYTRWLIQRLITVLENNTRAMTINTEVLRQLEKRKLCIYLSEKEEMKHGSDDSQN